MLNALVAKQREWKEIFTRTDLFLLKKTKLGLIGNRNFLFPHMILNTLT